MPAGRPTIRTPEIEEEILGRIAVGESVNSISKDPEMPGSATLFRWISEDPVFREKYAQAKALGSEKLADELLEIADDGRNDWMERNSGDNPGWVANGENTRRSALRIDTRKWLLAKLQPKKWGDKAEPQGLQIPSGTVARIELIPMTRDESKD